MKNKIRYLTAVAAIVIAAGAFFLFAPISGFPQVRGGTSVTTGAQATNDPAPMQAPAGLDSLQSSFRAVAKKVLPSVVEINVTEIVKQKVPQMDFPFNLPFPFFNQQPQGNGGNGGERTFRQFRAGLRDNRPEVW